MDLRLLRHGAAGPGLSLLLGHQLRAVPGLPGEMGSGRTLAEEGSQSVAEVHAGGERSPGSGPADVNEPLPAQTQHQRREPQPHTPALQHIHRMVSHCPPHGDRQPAVWQRMSTVKLPESEKHALRFTSQITWVTTAGVLPEISQKERWKCASNDLYITDRMLEKTVGIVDQFSGQSEDVALN